MWLKSRFHNPLYSTPQRFHLKQLPQPSPSPSMPRASGIRVGDRERRFWLLRCQDKHSRRVGNIEGLASPRVDVIEILRGD